MGKSELCIAVDRSLFEPGCPLAERKWNGGGLGIRVSLTAYMVSPELYVVMGDPSIAIGQQFFASEIPAANLSELEAHLAEARQYAAEMQAFVKSRIEEAIAMKLERLAIPETTETK